MYIYTIPIKGHDPTSILVPIKGHNPQITPSSLATNG